MLPGSIQSNQSKYLLLFKAYFPLLYSFYLTNHILHDRYDVPTWSNEKNIPRDKVNHGKIKYGGNPNDRIPIIVRVLVTFFIF